MRDDLETDVVQARKTLHQDDIKGMDLIQKETKVPEVAEETLTGNLIQDENFSKDFEVDLQVEGTYINEGDKKRKCSSEDIKQDFEEQLAELKKLTPNAGNLDDEKQSLNLIPVLPVLPRETENKARSLYRWISVDINLESSSDADKFDDENETIKYEQQKRKHLDERSDEIDIKKKVVESTNIDLNQVEVIPDPTIVKLG